MSITNPSWGVTQADVNALTQRTIPTLQNIHDGMMKDQRYGGYVQQIEDTMKVIQDLATTVQNYLAVQGT